jgi:hypothetical protein
MAADTLRCLTEAEKETGTEGANVISGFEVEGKGWGLLLASTRSKENRKLRTGWGARRQKRKTTR